MFECVVGCEDVARMFVPYAVGTNADRRFYSRLSERRITVVCHRVAKRYSNYRDGR